MSTQYICINGDFVKADTPVFTLSNRSFRYGDGLFESIRCRNTSPLFYDDHYQRLMKGMEVLKYKISDVFTKDHLRYYIERLLNKNKLYKGARLRLNVFRREGGLYTPATSDISFTIECNDLEENYALNQKGLLLGEYREMVKPVNKLSSIKSTSSLLYVLAGYYKKENHFDECLIYNQEGRIAETVSSNIFVVKGEKLTTPSLDEGCLEGVMRKQIIKIARDAGYTVDDNAKLTNDHLLHADELFITNAIGGIQWILGFRERRYYHKISEDLVRRLITVSSSQDSLEN